MFRNPRSFVLFQESKSSHFTWKFVKHITEYIIKYCKCQVLMRYWYSLFNNAFVGFVAGFFPHKRNVQR